MRFKKLDYILSNFYVTPIPGGKFCVQVCVCVYCVCMCVKGGGYMFNIVCACAQLDSWYY